MRRMFAALVLCAVWGVSPADAASCASSGSIAAAVRHATAIVTATVSRVELLKSRVTNHPDGSVSVSGASGPTTTHLAVDQVFKGNVGRQIQVLSDLPLREGTQYLLYFSGAADRLVLGACNRYSLLPEADQDLSYLRSFRAGAEAGVVHGHVARVGTGSHGLPLPVSVTVVAFGEQRYEASARIYGSFEIVLPPGRYQMWVEKSGRQLTNVTSVAVTPGDQIAGFAILDEPPNELLGDYPVTETGVGPIKLGATLEEARQAAPGATFRRTSDGDGAALVEVALTDKAKLVLYAGEESNTSPIDWTKKIERIEAFDPAFVVHPGIYPLVELKVVEDLWGAVTEIIESELEARQYVNFARQPAWLTMRIDNSGVFAAGVRRTSQYKHGARVHSLAIHATPSPR